MYYWEDNEKECMCSVMSVNGGCGVPQIGCVYKKDIKRWGPQERLNHDCVSKLLQRLWQRSAPAVLRGMGFPIARAGAQTDAKEICSRVAVVSRGGA
jgi:hypothetical protein